MQKKQLFLSPAPQSNQRADNAPVSLPQLWQGLQEDFSLASPPQVVPWPGGPCRAFPRWHIGDQPYLCSWPGCVRKFTRSDELHRHFRIHTGERKHKCGLCGKSFSRSDHLKKHTLSHHGTQEIQDSHMMDSDLDPTQMLEVRRHFWQTKPNSPNSGGIIPRGGLDVWGNSWSCEGLKRESCLSSWGLNMYLWESS